MRMARPLGVRRIAGSKRKTDTIASFELAGQLRMKRLPEAYVPPPELNERRQPLRYLVDLGKKMRTIKCQILALLDHNGVTTEHSDCFGGRGRIEMHRAIVRLPNGQRYLPVGLLAQLDLLGK